MQPGNTSTALPVPSALLAFPMTDHPDRHLLDQYSAVYPDIAAGLTPALPPDWRGVWVQVEMTPDNGSIACFLISDTAAKPVHVKLPMRVFDCFARMQRIALEIDRKHMGTTATFILRSDGTFNIDYGYDPIPIEGIVDRRIAWKKRYGLA